MVIDSMNLMDLIRKAKGGNSGADSLREGIRCWPGPDGDRRDRSDRRWPWRAQP